MKGIDLARQLAWLISVDSGHTYQQALPMVKNFYSGSRAILDQDVIDHLKTAPHVTDMLWQHDAIRQFQCQFGSWLLAHSKNTITGLERFQPDISQGSTQAFDSFYSHYANKRMVFFQGEYFYHVLTAKYLNRQYRCINDHRDLAFGDVLAISMPFCDTGSVVPDLEEILRHCDHNDIPVLIDASYFSIADDIHLNLDHPSIKTVAFSLSKTFPVAHARIGMRYIPKDWEDGQLLHSRINYNNRLSASLGSHIINRFPSDYITKKYRDFYDRLVEILELTPGNSVLFADGSQDYSNYGRKSLLETYGLDMDHRLYRNRICLTQLLEKQHLVARMLEKL